MSDDINLQKDVTHSARTSKLAIASLVLALLCVLFPLSFILSIVALVRCHQSGGRLTGSSLATGALCISMFSALFLWVESNTLVTPARTSNQRAAISMLKTLATTQEMYKRSDHDEDGVYEYAQNIKELAKAGLDDDLLIQADASLKHPARRAGYHFRILTGVTRPTPGALQDFMRDGNLVGGYVLVAFPAEYGKSGIQTYVMLYDGTIYERDLGPDTASILSAWLHVEWTSDWNDNSQ